LIEKYAGAFPLWLAPEQVKIMPIADRHVEYADKLYQQLRTLNFRCSVDDRAENVKKKIRDAQLEKIPYMLVLGDKEVETNTVSLRYRSGKTETLSIEDLLNKLVTERDNRTR
jgi:threonyl-tRNA synthetase